jgi:meiotically up-regulated gene 157 (Mug157) protein
MHDPSIPGLLSAPFLAYTTCHDPIYQNTRRKILSRDNPYCAWGPLFSGVGSMHTLPGKVWPMANIMAILTSDDEEEIVVNLKMLLRSTNGLGLMDESVNAYDERDYLRSWFSRANGLFGQAMLGLERRMPCLLELNFQ